ncbi:hypothetical protein CEXT_329601 [Caerostris extrusa]|uniref:Uncharacterized protein n=1 Tax=Caerostris extrusa TaxID=172846 RepID=A0AAV4XNB6_CAEEX|nr:hypothetical protein CEXT_329601 [Caerostris extrusa]
MGTNEKKLRGRELGGGGVSEELGGGCHKFFPHGGVSRRAGTNPEGDVRTKMKRVGNRKDAAKIEMAEIKARSTLVVTSSKAFLEWEPTGKGLGDAAVLGSGCPGYYLAEAGNLVEE